MRRTDLWPRLAAFVLATIATLWVAPSFWRDIQHRHDAFDVETIRSSTDGRDVITTLHSRSDTSYVTTQKAHDWLWWRVGAFAACAMTLFAYAAVGAAGAKPHRRHKG